MLIEKVDASGTCLSMSGISYSKTANNGNSARPLSFWGSPVEVGSYLVLKKVAASGTDLAMIGIFILKTASSGSIMLNHLAIWAALVEDGGMYCWRKWQHQEQTLP